MLVCETLGRGVARVLGSAASPLSLGTCASPVSAPGYPQEGRHLRLPVALAVSRCTSNCSAFSCVDIDRTCLGAPATTTEEQQQQVDGSSREVFQLKLPLKDPEKQ